MLFGYEKINKWMILYHKSVENRKESLLFYNNKEETAQGGFRVPDFHIC